MEDICGGCGAKLIRVEDNRNVYECGTGDMYESESGFFSHNCLWNQIHNANEKLSKVKRDSELLDLLEVKAKQGWCPCLLNDDSGHWAVVGDGMQNVPIDAPCDIQTTFWVEKHQWKNSVREALEEFAKEAMESGGNYESRPHPGPGPASEILTEIPYGHSLTYDVKKDQVTVQPVIRGGKQLHLVIFLVGLAIGTLIGIGLLKEEGRIMSPPSLINLEHDPGARVVPTDKGIPE